MSTHHFIIEGTGSLANANAEALLSVLNSLTNEEVLATQELAFGHSFGSTAELVLGEKRVSAHTWPNTHTTALFLFQFNHLEAHKVVQQLIAQYPEHAFQLVEPFHSTQEQQLPVAEQCAFPPEYLAKELLLKNPLLGTKITASTSLPTHKLQEGLCEVLKFLFLCSRSPNTLTPSKLIDDIWHEFILFTRSYQSFCEQHLNRFIHHQPSQSPKSEHAQYQLTLLQYLAEYGQPPTPYWPEAGICSADCGQCEAP